VAGFPTGPAPIRTGWRPGSAARRIHGRLRFSGGRSRGKVEWVEIGDSGSRRHGDRAVRGFRSETSSRSRTTAFSFGVRYIAREVGDRPLSVGLGATKLRSRPRSRGQSGARSLKTRCVGGAPARTGPDLFRTASGSEPCRETNRGRLQADRMLRGRHPDHACHRKPHVGGGAGPLTFSTGALEVVGLAEVSWQTCAGKLGRFPLTRGGGGRIVRGTVANVRSEARTFSADPRAAVRSPEVPRQTFAVLARVSSRSLALREGRAR